jgi:hypothetical protein
VAFGLDQKKVIPRYAIYLNAGTLDWDFTVIVVNYFDKFPALSILDLPILLKYLG